jgi:phosphoglycerate dehydrogenase-like enzyme
MKILVVNPRLAERIGGYLPGDIDILSPEVGTDEELIELAGDVEVILATRLSPEVALAAPGLRLLQKTGAGVDDLPFDVLDEGVWVANTSGSNPVPLAEGAVALVLALAKRIVQRHGGFRDGRDGVRGVGLKGKKAGILGLGSIGFEVATRLSAFEMDLLAVKRHPDSGVQEELDLHFLGGPGDLDRLLRESDFLVVTVPLTPETRGMIGERELRLMKPTSYLVNVARAAIIQEEPLYRALEEGWIAGAALDVWWRPHWWDPLWHPEGGDASEYPFWDLPNVICTPHNIGSTDARSDAGIRVMAENIRRVKEGRSPVNLVDKELRY